MVTPCSKQQHYIRSGSHPAANDTLIVCTQGVHRTTSSTFVFLFLSDVTCIAVSYIGLMLVDMGKVQYCHGHTRQCTTPSRRFSSVFCTTDVKCIARSYVCRIYTGHILLSSIGRTRIETTSTRMQQNSYVNTECHYMMYFS